MAELAGDHDDLTPWIERPAQSQAREFLDKPAIFGLTIRNF
jgi:hypothetical protein